MTCTYSRVRGEPNDRRTDPSFCRLFLSGQWQHTSKICPPLLASRNSLWTNLPSFQSGFGLMPEHSVRLDQWGLQGDAGSEFQFF